MFEFVLAFLNIPLTCIWDCAETDFIFRTLHKSLIEEFQLTFLNLWFVWWIKFSSLKHINIKFFEKFMLENFFDSSLSPNSLIFFLGKELVDQVLRLWTDINIMLNWVWECHISLLDQEEHLMLVFMEEWRDSNQDFV